MKRMILVRDVSVSECPWLSNGFLVGDLVFHFTKPTYGCIGSKGIACSIVENETPFFELPADAVVPFISEPAV